MRTELPKAAREALAGGLVELDAMGLARARASPFPVGNRLVFSVMEPGRMPPHPGRAKAPYDQVMAVGRTAIGCAGHRAPAGWRGSRSWTGSGVHALLAEQYETVTR